MTETTAKKGMVRYKTGHSKNDFDFDYLSSINYDDKRTLKQVIETLFTENKNLNEKIETAEKEFSEKLDSLKKEYDDQFTKFEETFEKNIRDFLTQGV